MCIQPGSISVRSPTPVYLPVPFPRLTEYFSFLPSSSLPTTLLPFLFGLFLNFEQFSWHRFSDLESRWKRKRTYGPRMLWQLFQNYERPEEKWKERCLEWLGGKERKILGYRGEGDPTELDWTHIQQLGSIIIKLIFSLVQTIYCIYVYTWFFCTNYIAISIARVVVDVNCWSVLQMSLWYRRPPSRSEETKGQRKDIFMPPLSLKYIPRYFIAKHDKLFCPKMYNMNTVFFFSCCDKRTSIFSWNFCFHWSFKKHSSTFILFLFILFEWIYN